MNPPLLPRKIAAALASLPGWSLAGGALTKTFQLDSFRGALAFMVRVGFEAEEMNHHPEWTNVYGKVVVRLSTHDAGGKVTALDVRLARRIEAIAAAAGRRPTARA